MQPPIFSDAELEKTSRLVVCKYSTVQLITFCGLQVTSRGQ